MFGKSQSPGGRAGLLLALLPFFSVFPALLLLLGALSPGVSRWCLKGADSVPALLRSCRNNGLILLLAMAGGVLITVLVTVFAIRCLVRKNLGSLCAPAVRLALIVLFLEGLLFWAMAWKESLVTTVLDAQADLRQAEDGTGEVRTVWFAAGSAPARLPLPYTKDQPKPLIACQVCDETGQWSTLYVPAALDFAPEGTYRPSEDREWNAENVPRYRLTCTGRLKWVLEVTPVS